MRAILFVISLFLIILSSCVDPPIEPQNSDINIDTTLTSIGIYVINEGLFNMNNSTLTWYGFDSKTAVTDFFEIKNGRRLGDTGNDIAIYGSKMYIVVNVSSQLEVVDAYTGISIARIPFFEGNKPRQPRYIAFHESKAYVCSFDGTVAMIDTASLQIQQIINVGKNPDGIAVANNKLYVSNSGGLDYPNYDNTVSVIDLNTFTEIKRIEVGINPYTISADNYGDIYVVSRGNYNDIKMKLQIIDSKTDELKYTFPDLEVLNLMIQGDTAFVYYYDYMSGGGSNIMLLDVKSESVLDYNFIKDGTVIETVYGIVADKVSGDVFISDARGFVNTGIIYCFNRMGNKKYSFSAGLNPGKMVILYNKKIDKFDF